MLSWLCHLLAFVAFFQCTGSLSWTANHCPGTAKYTPQVDRCLMPNVGLVACSSHTEVTFKLSVSLLVKQWLICNWTCCIIWMEKYFWNSWLCGFLLIVLCPNQMPCSKAGVSLPVHGGPMSCRVIYFWKCKIDKHVINLIVNGSAMYKLLLSTLNI